MRSRRGVVLLQTVMSALVCAMIASLLLSLSLNRRALAARQAKRLQGQAVAEAAAERAAACLGLLQRSECSAPALGCDAACGAPCEKIFGSFELALAGQPPFSVAVNVSAPVLDPAACTIAARCVDCPGPRMSP